MNPGQLEICLPGWVILDENYADFSVGDIPMFALEFGAADSLAPSTADPHLNHLGNARYDACGVVVFVSERVWVVDFAGFLAYCRRPTPHNVQLGIRIAGTVWVGIDAFEYFEGLNGVTGIPPLIYSWRVDVVEIDTTPLIEVPRPVDLPGSGKLFARDPARRSKEPRPCTDVHSERFGTEYYLTCTRLNVPAMHMLSTRPRAGRPRRA